VLLVSPLDFRRLSLLLLLYEVKEEEPLAGGELPGVEGESSFAGIDEVIEFGEELLGGSDREEPLTEKKES
jgi:hypothetical protein